MKCMSGIKTGLSLWLLSSASMAALADEPTWFIGIGQGAAVSDQKVEMANGLNSFEVAAITKFIGGYWISPHVGVEATYNHFAKIDSKNSAIQHTLDIDSVSMGMIGRLPLSEQISIMAKAGGMRWTAKEKYTGVENDGTTTFGGVGVAYNPFQHLGFRADWELINKVDTEQSGELRIHIVTLGIVYHF